MFRKLHKLNNSGSTLLTVMICLAIVSILGSLMLSVTLTNLQMKIVESKSKKNFYSCDAAMEELRTGLQELTAETIKEVYNDKVLTNYAAYIDKSEDEVNTSMQNMVTASLMKKLSDSAFDESELVTYTDLPAKVSEFTKYLTTVPGAMIEVTIESLNSAGNNVLVKGIHISYTKDDYKTSIDSDIRIILPKFTFTDGPEVVHYRIEQPFGKYVLVADGGIISSNSAGKNEIKGSVYAGDKGITVKNSGGSHGVDIAGEDIVTRGNITAADRA
ncbi:MAG TPA: hypothetical protein VN131_00395, partial [Mobilitalea sp.]|nr:hypothetical protein [Mobilitalea sp.]